MRTVNKGVIVWSWFRVNILCGVFRLCGGTEEYEPTETGVK